MANTANINIRMDANLKKQFEAFCADMGMTMTTRCQHLCPQGCAGEPHSLRDQRRYAQRRNAGSDPRSQADESQPDHGQDLHGCR